ncbi:MAG: hypothetical protein JO302_07190 [Candidatus Eremiobacteraeota bacterium]|nr:hypothetical protein [Candidatus Eremiobacteraeota bacterium]
MRTNDTYGFTDRLRDALVLGVAIPFGLGYVHLLYPSALWIALALCLAVAWRRGAPRGRDPAAQSPPYILIAAIAAIAWPSLMRPLLDGDTLSYHLPNAAAWSHAHGLWTTDSRYWWYPPASELFASALYTVAGPFTLPWSGFGVYALLGFRIYGWVRDEAGATPRFADALAAATVTAAPLALQAATLQNDVWLAAFTIETLTALRRRDDASAARSMAVAALLKPYGFLFASVCALAGRARLRVCGAAALPFVLWLLHDAVLWNSAIVPPASTSYGNTFGSTIVAHGLPALALLAKVAVLASPFAAILLLAALFAPMLAQQRGLGTTALFALAFYLVMPLAYSGPGPQLATGASLRYAAPAIALGALVLSPWLLRAAPAAVVALVLCAMFGVAQNVALYWFDEPARAALAIAPFFVAIVLVSRRASTAWPALCGAAAAMIASGLLAARFPASYYADALRYEERGTHLYAWIARTSLPAIGGTGLRLGTVNVLAPHSRTVDLPDAAPCAMARSQGVALVAVAEPERTRAFNRTRLRDARECGRTLYDDPIAVVSLP